MKPTARFPFVRREDDVSHLLLRNPGRPGAARWLGRALGGLLAVGLALALAGWLVLRLLLAPPAGGWSVEVGAGPVRAALDVPTLLRLGTSRWLGPHLDGHSLGTRWGRLAFGWEADTQTLRVRCAPCSAPVPALGTQPLRVDDLVLRAHADFNQFQGTLEAAAGGPGGQRLQARWTGLLGRDRLALELELPATRIADWYAVVAPHLPERGRAYIGGSLALRARATLPAGPLELTPVVSGFAVSGLGTERLAHASTSCGPSAGLRSTDWLARAVIAAEDQRFEQHAGYDLQELAAAWGTNQARGGVVRGGSTLDQQLAKLLVAGDERSAGRKLRELLYAVEMQQTLGKARILQMYLDNAPWGQGICGAEAAARHYFGRSARSLAPAQAVWLAAMLHNPGAELAQWHRSGDINRDRASWVADGVRGVPGLDRRRRASFIQSVAEARWVAPAARP